MASLGLLTGGTISVANGATTVTGSGTAFSQAFAGSLLVAGGDVVPISAIASDTELTISEAWSGAALASASYSIVLISQAHSLSAQNQQRLQELLNGLSLKGEIHYVTGAPASGLGDDGDSAIDTVSPGALYRKVNGAWELALEDLRGSGLAVDVVGLASNRSTYDAEPALFTFLAEDTGQLSIKRSATPGDWSAWIDFQGPKGDKGDVGAQWSTGAIPDDDTGLDGDLHIATTGAVYQKASGAWADTGINLVGPQSTTPGPTGPRGRSFDPDAQEPAANRVNYDGEAEGFAFLATDTSQVSWKQSATSGDWSTWVDWGGAGDSSGAGSTTPLGMFVAASL